jgi:predicted metal-dependent hydrolase
MRSKWGSCSTEGRVTLNQELLTASADLRREVIVKELLHLREPNHGKLFRALKARALGAVKNSCQPRRRYARTPASG